MPQNIESLIKSTEIKNTTECRKKKKEMKRQIKMIKTNGYYRGRRQKTCNTQQYKCRKCQCIQENIGVLIKSAYKFWAN